MMQKDDREYWRRWRIREKRSRAFKPIKGVTESEIMSKRTPRGGWKRDDLAKWGVPWPPPKGWKEALILTSYFEAYMRGREPDFKNTQS